MPKKNKDEIVEMVKNNFGLVRYGNPADPGTYMGPLISEKQRDKVDGMVKRAVEAGATGTARRSWAPARGSPDRALR